MKNFMLIGLMCANLAMIAAPAPCEEVAKSKVTMPLWSMDGTPFALSGDGTLLMTGQRVANKETSAKGSQWNVNLWQVPSGNLLRTLTLHNAEHLSLALSPDKKTFAVGFYVSDSYGVTEVYEVETLRQLNGLRRFPEQKEKTGLPFGWRYSGVTGVAFSPNGKYLASLHHTGDINLEEIVGHDEKMFLPKKNLMKGVAGTVAFSADGKTLLNIGSNGEVKVFPIQ